MKNFYEYYLIKEGGRRTGSKTELYPLGYSNIGLYPDSDYTTHASDAFNYLTHDQRLYNNGDNPPFSITHLPGHEQFGDKINNGENRPFDISHLKGEIRAPQETTLPGKIVSFKSFVDLVTKPITISPKASYLPD